MGRWRPPAEKSSPYITKEGYDRIYAELGELWKKRRRVTEKLKTAAAEGDRSENADYIYRKKQLREMDRRLGYLSRRVDAVSVVDRIPDDIDKVFFGAWVTVADEDDNKTEYRVVGADEFNADQNWISMDAPLGKALLGKSLDDELQIKLPDGPVTLWIESIRYQ